MPAAERLPPLFATLPEPFRTAYLPQAPWELLGEPLDRALGDLPEDAIEIPLGPDFHLVGGPFAIGKGTRIHPGAVIHGPARLGRDVEIRPGAFLRGGIWLEDGCVVGANCEVKRAIFMAGAKAPHLNYVGDSILGARVNLGAGTVLSNLRHDGAEVVIPAGAERLASGRRKLGAILGDGVLTGCNCVLHPGVIVGAGTHVYPLAPLRPGVYPAQSILKLRQRVEAIARESARAAP